MAAAEHQVLLANAHLNRWWYLLTRGMWKSQCAFTVIGGEPERILMVATVSGSARNQDFAVERVFYTEEGALLEDYVRIIEEKVNRV